MALGPPRLWSAIHQWINRLRRPAAGDDWLDEAARLANLPVMHPDAERFIDLATRPLGDNAELKLSAQQELRKSIDAENRPEALREAADALERADRHRHRKWWRMLWVGLTLLISLPLLGHTVWQLRQVSVITSLVSAFGTSSHPVSHFPHLTPQQNLLMFGAGEASNGASNWKPLWESDPENPAYLAEYALAYFNDHKTLSPEILAAAERLDPENGWFLTLRAAGIAEGAVTRERRPSSKLPNPVAPVYRVDDEKRLRDALAMIHQLSVKPRCHDWRDELIRQRIALLPARRDTVSQIPAMTYALSQVSGSLPKRKLVDVLAAGAQQCAATGDVEGFRQITRDWKLLTEACVKDSGNYLCWAGGVEPFSPESAGVAAFGADPVAVPVFGLGVDHARRSGFSADLVFCDHPAHASGCP